MKKYFILIFLALFLNACSSGNDDGTTDISKRIKTVSTSTSSVTASSLNSSIKLSESAAILSSEVTTESGYTYSSVFDEDGKVTRVTQTYEGLQPLYYDYTYDENGKIIKWTHNESLTGGSEPTLIHYIDFEYDTDERLSKKLIYYYYVDGNPQGISEGFHLQSFITYEYDENGYLNKTEVHFTKEVTPTLIDADNSGEDVRESHIYTVDSYGKLIEDKKYIVRSSDSDVLELFTTTTFSYNEENQLVVKDALEDATGMHIIHYYAYYEDGKLYSDTCFNDIIIYTYVLEDGVDASGNWYTEFCVIQDI